MRAISVVSTLASVASLGNTAIVVGDEAKDISLETWESVTSSPSNSTSSRFIGFDTSKPYPSSEQEGWELSIDVKDDVTVPSGKATATTMSISLPNNGTIDDSWHFCVYTFNVKASSAYEYFAGQKDSCTNLVLTDCTDDLKKIAVQNSGPGSCNSFRSTASCLRDISEQSALSLSVSANNASNAFGTNATFFRRLDSDPDPLNPVAGQPMLVVTVFGSSTSSDKAPTAEVARVQPNAKEKTSAASHITSFVGFSAAAAVAMALQLIL